MLYHFLYPLSQEISTFNIFRYITFRSIISFLVAAGVSILWGKIFISSMRKWQFGQVVRDFGPKSHFKKAGTPTMGGIFIFCSVLLAFALCGNFYPLTVTSTLAIFSSYFVLGLIDDYLKVLKKNSNGISVKGKLLWQAITAFGVGIFLIQHQAIDTMLYIPFLKEPLFDMGQLYPFFITLVIVGTSNAVNLTDGLDGLAIGPIMTSAASLGILTYAAGHKQLADYLYIPYIENVGELTVLCMAILGAGVGFLWYNSYPAQVFMGDVGSLSLGGALGAIAVMSKNELLFTIIGGVFVAEAISVITQVTSYKLRKKRIFLMAPIHHHFELKGWPEPKVIVRFWIVSLFLALISLATLKMR